MNKSEFLNKLTHALNGMPAEDIAGSLDYYSEMIDDRIESGMGEEEAVGALGSPENIAREIMTDMPLSKFIKTKYENKKLTTAEMVLIILGSPIWISLGIAAFSVILGIYIAVWSVVIAFWALGISFIFSAVVLAAVGISFFSADLPFSLMYIGVALFLAGISVFTVYGCVKLSAATGRISTLFFNFIKSFITRKERGSESSN